MQTAEKVEAVMFDQGVAKVLTERLIFTLQHIKKNKIFTST
jgi:hypothetical protein